MTFDAEQPFPNTDIEQGQLELLADESVLANLSDVEVTTDRAVGRERQISAKIYINHSAEHVWQVLTDYEHLADFIPNLSDSYLIDHPANGVRLVQVGAQSFLRVKFCARVVLDMIERFPYQLDFQMVEGDFKAFSGSWLLTPTDMGDRTGTYLCYTVSVLPPRTMPIRLIENRLKQNFAVNLNAIRQRVDELFGSN